MPQILIPYTVHLDHTLRVTPLSTLFAKGDSAAHRFQLTILRAGVQEDLTGCTVMCKFYRMADSTVVSVPGTVEDGKAVAVLGAACYDYIGRFALTIAIKKGEEETTVFYGDGYMHGQRADTAISGEYIIYDIDTLLEKIAEIDAATQAANTATSNANTATGKANTAASSANTAAANANAAADAANAAAKDWGDSTAANSYKLGGKAPEYYIQPRNLLDNSDFRNPVMQAGFNGLHGSEKYVIDRWLHMYQLGSAEKVSDGIALTGAEFYMSQKIGEDVSGKTLTFAVCLADGSIVCGAANVSDMSEEVLFSQHEELYLMLVNGYFSIRNASESTYTIRWAVLYEGSYTADTLPPYVPKGYAAELAECQRYSVDFGDTVFRATKYNDTLWALNVQLPTKMRVIPTVEALAAEGEYPSDYPNISKNGISWYKGSVFTIAYLKAYADP